VILSSTILPRYLGYLAIALSLAFITLGITSIYTVALTPAVTSLAAIQSGRRRVTGAPVPAFSHSIRPLVKTG